MGDLYAMVSAGGSPGLTTTALALALTWPSPVVLAECDPSGGDILAGLLAGNLPAGRGLMEYAMEAGRSSPAADASSVPPLVSLDEDRTRMLLPGLTDPRQAAGLVTAWPAIAASLTAQAADVIADCGRLDAGAGQPLAVLSDARTVVIVLRPTLRQVWLARPRVELLGQLLGSSARLALLLTGPGTHPAREVASALGLPLVAALPADARTAAVLSDGLGDRGHLARGSLIWAAGAAGEALRNWHAAPSWQPLGERSRRVLTSG
ncbi:MAG TPA: hypothetical protein VMA32_11405 [Streptosporangiaceae bacterium]|nr:hypothetical protein [Streptosporangiaceae bacterium]